MKRRWLLWLALATVIITAGASVAARSLVGSSSALTTSEADETNPTASVTLQHLVIDVRIQGEIAVRMATFSSAIAPLDEIPVLTSVAIEDGGTIRNGTLLCSVGSRPVIAIANSVPLFRTLGVGMHGEDVQRLQMALREWTPELAVDGEFGRETAGAVIGLYERLGFDAPVRSTSVEELEAMQAERVAAQAAVDAARAALSAAAATDPLAVAEAELGVKETKLALSETLRASQAAIDSARGDVEAAQAALNEAEANGDETAIEQAKTLLAQAELSLEDAEAQAELQVERASLNVDVAQALLDLALSPDTTTLRRELLAAEEAEKRLSAKLDALTSATNVEIPIGELVAVPDLPRNLLSFEGEVGSAVPDPLFAVAVGAPIVSVPEDRLPAGYAWDRVEVSASIAGEEVSAKYLDITRGDSAHVRFELGVPVSASPEGQTVTITVLLERTTEPVLSVPASALRQDADGVVFVRKIGNGGVDRIPVEVGLVAPSGVEIAARDVGALADGDLVELVAEP